MPRRTRERRGVLRGMSFDPKNLDDRTLELRIIRAAADQVGGGPVMLTMHEIRVAVQELARRHPKGYPAVSGVSFTVPWPEAPTLDEAERRRRADPEDQARYRCAPGRPETWPADDLENAVGEALDKIKPSCPRIPAAVHRRFDPQRETDEEYRNRLRAESRHDIGRIHGRALDVAEHTYDACAPKGGYPASTASRALAVGIITAVFEEIERRRTSATARAEHTYRAGDEVEVDASAHGWCQGTVKHANDWGVVVYWSYGDGKITGSTPVPWGEVRSRVRRRDEYRVGDEVEVKTGGPGSIWGAAWELATVDAVGASLEVTLKHRGPNIRRRGIVKRDHVRRPAR